MTFGAPLPWLLVALLSGCEASNGAADSVLASDPEACFETLPSAELGTGEGAFVPVANGDQVPVIHGSQGGNHILGSVRVHHMSPIVLVHYSLTNKDAEVVSDQSYRILLVDEGDCAASAVGLYGYLGFLGGGTGSEDAAVLLLWTNVQMKIDVTDTEGRFVSAEATIVPTPGEPPDEPPVVDTGEDTGDTAATP